MLSSYRRLLSPAVLAVLLLLPCGAARTAKAAPPTARTISAAVSLRRTLPSEVVRLLVSPAGFVANGEGPAAFAPDGTILPSAALLPPGIVSLAPDDAARVLRVQGTPTGVSGLRDLVRLLDVPRALVRLRVRLLREQEGASSRTLVTAQATTGNGVPVPITLRANARSFGNVIATVSPRINGDGSITLSVDLRVVEPASQNATLRFLQAQRRLRSGEPATFSVLDVPSGDGSNAKPARVLLEITPEKMGPSPGRA